MTVTEVDRYDPGRVSGVGDRAVVVGGSVAGLCAARVLADAFEAVTVVERDPLPDEPVTRDGAPQTHHPHALLEAGRATLEDFFPGFGETLLAEGGLLIDAFRDIKWYTEGGYVADAPNRSAMYTATRPLFEYVVRGHVNDLENVEVLDEHQFRDYLATDDGGRVTGVRVTDDAGEDRGLEADLVVDAMGRTSRTASWLEDQGYEAPPVDEVDVDVAYSTVRVERPPDDRRMFFVPPDAPRTRGAYYMPVEDGRWEVLLQGMHGEEPPTGPEDAVAFAETLPVPELAQLLDEQDWETETAHSYRFPSSRRRRYEALDRFPDGLVVTGDAMASFNPIYGQGMSMAALDALVLHHALAADGLEDLGPRFFDRAGDIVDEVWQLAVGSDFAFAETTGPKPTGADLFNRYVSRLTRQAQDDPVLREAIGRVILLERPVSSLLRPGVAWRVLRPGGS